MTPDYGKGRYPKARYDAGKKVCRGCGGPIGYRRQSWCSAACYRKFCPQMVLMAVRQRDKGICQLCFTRAIRPEYDHIQPFSEGGLTVLENMRTVCHKCHKQRTNEWRKQRIKP